MRERVAELGLAAAIEADSAGTQGFHAGEPPDHRSQRTALKHGVDLSGLRARKIAPADFETFDIIAAMDRGHLDALRRQCPTPYLDRLHLFMDFASAETEAEDVPDPYYGEHGFEEVFSMVEQGVQGLIAHIRQTYGV